MPVWIIIGMKEPLPLRPERVAIMFHFNGAVAMVRLPILWIREVPAQIIGTLFLMPMTSAIIIRRFLRNSHPIFCVPIPPCVLITVPKMPMEIPSCTV